MLKPPVPVDETARLFGLHSLRILDSVPEERYDRITRIARRLFGVRICLFSLVDTDRQWFKSRQGLEACETGREESFCGHAILDDRILVVQDTRQDSRFADNPLVLHDPYIRFYAGCPIHAPTGHRVGTLCLIDTHPRDFCDEDQQMLRDMATMVENELRAASNATVDELTQIANRRGFNTVAERILSLCRRTKIDAELFIFDLDGLKKLNDSQGHAAGDRLLQEFGRLLLKCFQEADVVARLGGDEFVVLMTATDESHNTALARLKSMTDRVYWSAGRATFNPGHHESVHALLAEADARLYEHKARRRTARA